MAAPSDNLPPNLKVFAEMLQATATHPATAGLLEELTFIASKTPAETWAPIASSVAPVAQIMALGLAGSFAASGALSVSVSGGSGGVILEPCPVGCGRRRTTK